MMCANVGNQPGFSPRTYANAIVEYLTKKHSSKKYTMRSLDWPQSSVSFAGESFRVGIYKRRLFINQQIGSVAYIENLRTNNITIELIDDIIQKNELEEIVKMLKEKRGKTN